MNSDLEEAVEKLKAQLEKSSQPFSLGRVPYATITRLNTKLELPGQYCSFLQEANPLQLKTTTPVEVVEFIAADDLLQEQAGFTVDEALKPLSASAMGSWRRHWIVVARSGLLGDPYFLDTSKSDAEGDCPVYSAMSGKDRWEPHLAASSFVQFLQILAASLEVAADFGEADVGVDDEDVFREALAPKIRSIDPAALRAGHWT